MLKLCGSIVVLSVWLKSDLFTEASFLRNETQKSQHNHETSAICSDAIKAFQIENMDLVSTHICDGQAATTPWQLTHLVYPDINVFLDIGGNRGYTAAEFFGTWSPGHGLNRKKLYKAIKEDVAAGLYQNNQQLTTYCGDGDSDDKPMICAGRNSNNHPCNYRRNIQVYSFDGQTTHVNEVRGTIYRHFPQVNPNYTISSEFSKVKASFEYIHAAMTDTVPEGEKFGYFLVVHHEAGRLIKEQKTAKPGTNLVPLLTVDMFCAERKLTHTPVLKIDAEGSDDLVIYGAEQTILHRGVKVISFECWDCMGERMKALVENLDTKYGFDCYQVGQYNLYLKLTNCWDYSYAQRPNKCATEKCSEFESRNQENKRKIDGNTFCVHRKRGSVLHALVESLSLHRYYADHRGDINKDALLSNNEALFDKIGKLYYENKGAGEAHNRRTGRDQFTGEKIVIKKNGKLLRPLVRRLVGE